MNRLTSALTRVAGATAAALAATLALTGAAALTAAPAHAASKVKTNDYDRDGVSDLVAVNRNDNCLYRWSGNGSGGFRTGTKLGCGWQNYVDSLVAVGDINRDGVGDLVAINKVDGYLYRWYGNGSGSFGASARLGYGWSAFGDGRLFSAGDINRDGVGDLIGMNGVSGAVVRWYGNGAGSFGAAAQIDSQTDGEIWYFRYDLTGAGDLNKDGVGDVIGWNPHYTCPSRFLGNGAGNYGPSYTLTIFCQVLDMAGMGDLNGDGIGDVVGKGEGFRLHVGLGDGRGGIARDLTLGPGWEPFAFAR
ncbi:MAG: VCBS repeat-containing protein [Kineosporiaceae bacterium]